MKESRDTNAETNRLIDEELVVQRKKWGDTTGRDDATNGELAHAAEAQLAGLRTYLETGTFPNPLPAPYPAGWSNGRDYGSPIANLVVAAAFLKNEIDRRLRLGEDSTRRARDPKTEPRGRHTGPTAEQRSAKPEDELADGDSDHRD